MLEPAVRPGQQPVGKVDTGRPAFEHRSFQDLLSEAAAQPASAEQAGQTPATNPLDPLGGLGQIENAALRSVLAKGGGRVGDSA